MSSTQDEPTLQEMSRRLAELERANARLHEELGALQAKHSTRGSPRITDILGLTAREQVVPLLPDVLGVFRSSVAGTPAVSATGTSGADGVDATSDSNDTGSATGAALFAHNTNIGVQIVGPDGRSTTVGGTGLYAQSDTGLGIHAVGGGATPVPVNQRPIQQAAIFAEGGGNIGLYAIGGGATPADSPLTIPHDFQAAILAEGGPKVGVFAICSSGVGIGGASGSGTGVFAESKSGSGIFAQSGSGFGVFAGCDNGPGVLAQSTNSIGLQAVGGGAIPTPKEQLAPSAILAEGGPNPGIFATSNTGNGVSGRSGSITQGSTAAAGVFGSSPALNSNGVIGEANNGAAAYGVWGISNSGFAGFFSGNVSVTGTLSKGGGGFRIDHPLDPENKYLSHSFVESPDMLNVYNGNVTTDANGDAAVTLPDYFEALNRDFRYQLTVIGQFAQAMVAEEIRNNQFAIKTDQPNIKVSWQVTGVRKDPFAEMHRLLAEEDKRANERGRYLHPEAYGKPETQSIEHALGKVLKEP